MSEIEWDSPIEAYHSDGRVARVEYVGFSSFGNRAVQPSNRVDGANCFKEDGTAAHAGGWKIRNVSNTISLDKTLWERIEALVRKIGGYGYDQDALEEAGRLAKLLPKPPVDSDSAKAKLIVESLFPDASPQNENALHQSAYAGITCGRELEREGK